MDPSKFKAIMDLQPRWKQCQLQSIQGKANFLYLFVPNYATRAWHGFLQLLHKETPFQWDDHTQSSFK